MRKLILVTVLLALAVFGGWKVYGEKSSLKNSVEAPRLATIALGDINETVTAQGKLEAKEYVDVGTQVSGQLLKLHVDIGDEVKQGDLLVEIDPRIYETSVDADKARLNTLAAQLAEQESSLKLARLQHERNARLIKSDAVSRDAFEQSEAAFKAGQSRVAALQAEIEEARSTLSADETNVAYTKITAPMSGTVVDLPMREGQTVNASQTAPTILRIADMSVMTVRAQVAEADIMRLKPGNAVYFTTMGQMERRWPGLIRQVLPTPEIINDVVLYNVLIDSKNKDNLLMNSMSTQVFFTVGEGKNIPLVPAEALNQRDIDQDNEKGNAYTVKIALENGKTEDRLIHVGLMNRMFAEVRDGLKAGEQIVLPPLPSPPPSSSPSGGRGFGGPRL